MGMLLLLPDRRPLQCKARMSLALRIQMAEFGQQHARDYSFQPPRDLADILGRVIGNEHMHMIAGHLTRNDFDFVLQCNLSQKVPGSNCKLPREHWLPVLENPDEVTF